MGVFYDRKDADGKIIITHKISLYFLFFIIFAYGILRIFYHLPLLVITILLAIFIIGYFKAHQEIYTARKNKKLSVEGKLFSFVTPKKYIIEK